MRLLIILFPLLILGPGMTSNSFREKQMRYSRVREAYIIKYPDISLTFVTNSHADQQTNSKN